MSPNLVWRYSPKKADSKDGAICYCHYLGYIWETGKLGTDYNKGLTMFWLRVKEVNGEVFHVSYFNLPNMDIGIIENIHKAATKTILEMTNKDCYGHN